MDRLDLFERHANVACRFSEFFRTWTERTETGSRPGSRFVLLLNRELDCENLESRNSLEKRGNEVGTLWSLVEVHLD